MANVGDLFGTYGDSEDDKQMLADIHEASGFDLTDWESEFLESIAEHLGTHGTLTEAQLRIVKSWGAERDIHVNELLFRLQSAPLPPKRK